jgi:site-specific DNA recombinase
MNDIPEAGQIDKSLAAQVHPIWMAAAESAGISLAGFDSQAPLADRIAWATSHELVIGCSYLRYSSSYQHSDEDQLRANVVHAAQNRIYVPPEHVCFDAAKSGRSKRRAGLQRINAILQSTFASVLLIFTMSRLYRRSYEAFRFVQEEVVEAGNRAIAVAQQIDTADEKAWKIKSQIYMIMDDLLIETIAENCREGLRGLHGKGWVTGAIGVGYRPVEVKGAPLTNRGLPRMVPEIDLEAARLIRLHAKLHLDGMSLRQGCRRWNAAGGPCDPRSTTGRMTPTAYRRLWSNIRLTGRWEFGRNRNKFQNKKDYTSQVEQPDEEVSVFESEELRILDDKTFVRLQEWLGSLKTGPHGPRKEKPKRLWDLTTGCFFCAACSKDGKLVRLYQTGAHGRGMQCKNGVMCACQSAVRREDAVSAVCDYLAGLLVSDSHFIDDVVRSAISVSQTGHEDIEGQMARASQRLGRHKRRVEDLFELLGDCSDEDRRETKARIRKARTDRSAAEVELQQLRDRQLKAKKFVDEADVRSELRRMAELLSSAAAGELGEDIVYEALSIFRRLTGGQIMVHVERRPARKQTNVRGTFRPMLLNVVVDESDLAAENSMLEEVSVWLREPPLRDRLAPRVHQLIDIDGHSYRRAAKVLQQDGYEINSGVVYQIYERHYEMQGLPKPPRKYNNGRPRGNE